MAPDWQFSTQAPHSMHPSLSMIFAFRSSMANTSWGQTFVHILQPVHTSRLCLRVETPDRYLNFCISLSNWFCNCSAQPANLRFKAGFIHFISFLCQKCRSDPSNQSNKNRNCLKRYSDSHLLFYSRWRCKRS